VLTVAEIRTEITRRMNASIEREKASVGAAAKYCHRKEREPIESFKRWINTRLKEQSMKWYWMVDATCIAEFDTQGEAVLGLKEAEEPVRISHNHTLHLIPKKDIVVVSEKEANS